MSDDHKNEVNDDPCATIMHPHQICYLSRSDLSESSREVDVRSLIRIVADSKVLLFLVIFASLVVACAYIYFKTPTYTASVLLMPVNANQDRGELSALASKYSGLASVAGINLGASAGTKEEAIATLASRAFTDAFIEDNNLMPVLFAKRWDSKLGRWNTDGGSTPPTINAAYDIFNRYIRTISEDGTNGLVTLTINWKNPVQARDWASKLVARLNGHLRQKAIDEATQSIQYLKSELARTNVIELRQGIFRLIEAQLRKKMLAHVRKDFVFRVIDPAVVPDRPSKPRKILVLGLSLLLGTFVGLVSVFFRHAFR